MKYFLLSLLLYFTVFEKGFSLSIPSQTAIQIAERIWKNECAGTKEGLTNWKKGENFASLGIGHFIWYPQGKKERFEETFPSLLVFFEKEGILVPDWLKKSSGCPWNSREEFSQEMSSSKMKSLRQFLFDTRHVQAIFIANRLETLLPTLLEHCSQKEKEKISQNFSRLAEDANGLYALVDYVNFKGSGISPAESYNGQGWGLLQVLKRLSPSSSKPLQDFVNAAKTVLKERVQNAPPERQEEQWLKGWMNRLDTYLIPL